MAGNEQDRTIHAISSAPGGVNGAARAILRLSGSAAWRLARGVAPGLPPRAGFHGELAIRLLHPTLPCAQAVLFKSPRSFTGEDIAELHLPGCAALLSAVAAALGEAGSEPAQPGEFSARAFFNGKIDLTQAEGIAATIQAGNLTQLRAAATLREGALHAEIDRQTEALADVLALIEAGIDFTDEPDISFISAEKTEAALEGLAGRIDELLRKAVRVERRDALPVVVLVGKPNVGKSSLMNVLTGSPRAIVSAEAGTTRDMLAAVLHAPGGDIRLVDVPGEEAARDELREKMMAARRLALLEADLVLRVVDCGECAGGIIGEDADAAGIAACVIVRNKADLLPTPEREGPAWREEDGVIYVSAKTGWNIAILRERIVALAGRRESLGQGQMALNQRHRLLLMQAREAIRQALAAARSEAAFRAHPELVAADLRRALDLLGQITGLISPDEILGRVFATFCVGK